MTTPGLYDPYLVALSLFIAIIASFTALGLAARGRALVGLRHRLWLAGAAIALGSGIWSMHFVGMLAFSMPHMTLGYAIGPTLLSLAVAIGFTGAGFAIHDWNRPTARRILAAGVLIGTGVASMHYIGMAGMKMAATRQYDPFWVAVSIAIAMVAATAAIWLAGRDHGRRARAGAAVMMGVAIAGMHYTGMRAATFRATAEAMGDDPALFSQRVIALAVGLLTLTIMGLGLGALQLERRFDRSARREARLRFLSELGDTMIAASDARTAMAAATRLLGQRLGASRCAYADVDADGDRFWIRSDYTAPGQPSSVGEHRLSQFGTRAERTLRAGETLMLTDAQREMPSGDGREAFDALGIRAIICCPLVSGGRLVAMMAVHQDRARAWTAEEIALVGEAVERCWAHVQRVGTEERLRESEERLRLAVDNAEVGFWDLDVVRNELIWPARTKALFGLFSERPATLQDFDDGLHPDDRAPTWDAFRAAMDPARRAFYDVEYRTVGLEDGVVRWIAAKGRAIFTDGQCVRVTGTVVDITARKLAEDALKDLNATLEARIAAAVREREEAQEALRQSQKLESMGQLTGGVAHDFNNLLTPIIGSLDLIERKKLGGEREQRLIAAAIQSADRARTLVQRLLAFARRQPLQPRPVDVADLVRGMQELMSSTLGARVQLAIDAPPGLPAARADQNQLEMAILNLAVNARDAMDDGGTLTVSVRCEAAGPDRSPGLAQGDYLMLSVADTGCGMDEATLARAAEPFFSTKGVGKGTGLGLSMVHGLASQLGGALTIRSRPGEGTTVSLWLPVTESDLPRTESATGDPAFAGGTGTALVVDDEPLVRASTADMMGELGYQVTEADGAAAALRLMAEGARFDLLVTDHMMPGMTGTELARRVRETGWAGQVLVVSGYADSEAIDPDLPCLAKPFRRDELAACLSALSAGRAAVGG